ncbi:P1 family peptidase [Tropicibacter naphthalenivorans]|uniref:L-aminopeptidase/D-esterase n=1 Tax=Tropicibacter naphthalenivorans TaxID=441103 RepID=A0A0P1G0A8_9RHOB|nr:P1 family peptidase [Tropicibacter naphthalenivorans]CUH75010.1 L-aminopeptidase/D-esterase [Tropicibacter naphthalenivorans]SMC47438.1 D-aminopeptidase [Tropicibacter naphthalenivorans]
MKPGPQNLITDVAGLHVGNAQDDRIKSGVTVLTADAPFTASVAVHGGAPGTRETDLLSPDKSAPGVDALVLSGGSAFGLAAAQGVMDALHAQGRGFPVFSARVPIVPAAIIFDLLNGGDKAWGDNPYPALGARALTDASGDFALGSVGAGTGAQTAQHKGGLGSASLVLDDGTTVGALVAVNPMGSVTTPSGRHFWAAPFELDAEYGALGPDPAPSIHLPHSRKVPAMAQQGNTTIAIVATDACLDKAQCHRMAVAAHDGLARAILPAHSPMDGDLVFAAATGARELIDPHTQLAMIGHAASLCLSRAIARAVWEATPAPGDTLPTLRSELGL